MAARQSKLDATHARRDLRGLAVAREVAVSFTQHRGFTRAKAAPADGE